VIGVIDIVNESAIANRQPKSPIDNPIPNRQSNPQSAIINP
jgi:hypothetical protein